MHKYNIPTSLGKSFIKKLKRLCGEEHVLLELHIFKQNLKLAIK